MQIIGDGVDPPPVGAQGGIGGALDGLASVFMDTGQQQMRQAALAAQARSAAAQQGMGQIYASAMNPDTTGIDPRMGAAVIGNGGSIADVFALNRAYATTHGGVDAPLNAALATATNNFPSTPLSQKRSEAAASALSAQQAAQQAENNKVQAAAGANNHIVNQGGALVDPTGKVLYQNNLSVMTPDAIEMTAQRVVQGDPNALVGLSRGGTANIPAILDRAAKIAENPAASGVPVDAATAAANVIKGKMEYTNQHAAAQTSGQAQARMDIYGTEAATMAGLAKQASGAVGRSDFVPLALAEQALQTATNDPALGKFVAANNALINSYAKAISPTGAPLDKDKDAARAMLNVAKNQQTYAAIVDQMVQEINAAHNAPRTAHAAEQAGTAGRALVPGAQQGAAPAAPAPAPTGGPVTTVRTPEDVRALPPGTRFVIPDGSGRVGTAP